MAIQVRRLQAVKRCAYHRSAMSTRRKKPKPRDYLEPGHLWISEAVDHDGRVARGKHGQVIYGGGRLRPNTPGTVVLLQNISLRLRTGLDSMDRMSRGRRTANHKDITYRMLAKDTGLSLRTINDLIQGKTWPTVETIANLEMYFEADLWAKDHIDLVTPKGRKNPQRGFRRRANPSAEYRRRQACEIPPPYQPPSKAG